MFRRRWRKPNAQADNNNFLIIWLKIKSSLDEFKGKPRFLSSGCFTSSTDRLGISNHNIHRRLWRSKRLCKRSKRYFRRFFYSIQWLAPTELMRRKLKNNDNYLDDSWTKLLVRLNFVSYLVVDSLPLSYSYCVSFPDCSVGHEHIKESSDAGSRSISHHQIINEWIRGNGFLVHKLIWWLWNDISLWQ